MNKPILVFISLLLLAFELEAQYDLTHAIKFDENDGFKMSNYIGDVKQDLEGNIWIVNFNQVIKYDGISFREIRSGKTKHNALLRYIQSSNGASYVFDYSGLLFEIVGDSLIPYEYNSILKELKASSDFTDLEFDSNNKLHISYNNSSYLIIDDGQIERPLKNLNSNIKGELLIIDEEESTFLTFSSKGAYSAEVFYTIDQNYNIIDSAVIHKKKFVYPKSKTNWVDGRMYFSNGRGNFFEISQSGKIREHEFEHPIVNLMQDKNGVLWISTYEKGIFRYNTDTQAIEQNYFPNTTSVASLEDIEGGVWLYSYEEGLILLPYPNFEYINSSTHPSLPHNVTSLAIDGKNLLIANSGPQIYSFEVTKNALDSFPAPKNQPGVTESMYRDLKNNVLWLSKRGRVFYKAKNENWKSFNTNNLINFNARSKLKFLGYDPYTECNIAVYDERYFLFRDSSIKYVSPAFEDEVFTVLIKPNETYISTYAGVFKQKGEQIQDLRTQYPELKERAHSITEFNGSLYISIKNGSLFKLEDAELKAVEQNGQKLENANMIPVSEDSMWCLANQGSFLFIRDKAVQAFDKLPEIVVANQKWNGTSVFWATINKGVFHTPFESIMMHPLEAVQLRINSLKINGENKVLADSVYEVSYNRSFVQIDYQALTLKDWPITYRYKMEGLNENWVSSKERSTQFTTLPIGEYTFEIQARKGQQLWSPSAKIRFVVHPPIWREWWFILVSISFLALMAYYLITYRFKIIKREKDLVIDKLKAEQRALRAQMDPHFVFNVVASAQYLVMKEENEKAIEFLNKFSVLMRSTLDHSNSNLISLEQEIQFIENYIKLEKMRLEDSFDYQFEILVANKESIHIPPFILQPFIENSIHHGLKNKDGEKRLHIQIDKEKSFLKVVIKDNGIGRANAGQYYSKEKMKRKSHGIRIIKERLELHNNIKDKNVVYTDPSEGGTEVTIRIKIDQS